MANITTRQDGQFAKGSPLTAYEMDLNFLELSRVVEEGDYMNVAPLLHLDFTNKLDPRIINKRSTHAPQMYVDKFGVAQWTTRANQLRVSYDPLTRECQGLMFECDRANLSRNNTTGSTWTFFPSPGLTFSIVGTGTEYGMKYVELLLSGTASNSGSCTIHMDPTHDFGFAGSARDIVASTYYKLVSSSGEMPTTLKFGVLEYDTGNSLIVDNRTLFTPPTNANPIGNRIEKPFTTNLSTKVAKLSFLISSIGGRTYNFQFRLYYPQLELGLKATSPMESGSTVVSFESDKIEVESLGSILSGCADGCLVADYKLIRGDQSVAVGIYNSASPSANYIALGYGLNAGSSYRDYSSWSTGAGHGSSTGPLTAYSVPKWLTMALTFRQKNEYGESVYRHSQDGVSWSEFNYNEGWQAGYDKIMLGRLLSSPTIVSSSGYIRQLKFFGVNPSIMQVSNLTAS